MQQVRPSSSTTALSIVWALAPLFTCGVGTPFTMGFAAARRRAPVLWVAAVLYLASLAGITLVLAAYSDTNSLPDWAAMVVVVGLFTAWIGGTIHSLAIRSVVFGPRPPRRGGTVLPPPPHAYRPTAHPQGNYPPPGWRPQPGQGPVRQPPASRPQPPRPYPQDRPQYPPQDRPRYAAPGTPSRPQAYPQAAQPYPQGGQERPAYPAGATPQDRPSYPATPARTPYGSTPEPPRPPRETQRETGPAVTLPAPDKTSVLHSGATLPGRDPGPLPAGEPTHIERYRLIGSLGEGGQGAVYLAETPEGARVAIKVLHARLASEGNARQRFLREVEAARRVAPFSTARVIDAGVSDDRLFIVSEYVEGASLEQLVRERGPRGHDGLVRLALGTSGALAAIHRAGIVHRDFKPSNVLIGADGPRVVDFGIARVLDNATATSSGALGTPAYMSPEQVSGERVGPPSDIFSWAGTIVFAATGKPAFGEDNIAAVFNRIFTKQPDLSALPGSLAEVIGKCLDKKPENRPTASDVMLAIVQ
ncbi:serine/threonine-protein kinase [Sphaerisporangium aureirubrum]|uniref:non-specific serine/threonine protein kinase n=1 Tax=Sphaerisporangium aureirubrum TaxID=1544736 RepID=A0ABW1N9P5_9ACTN